MQFIPRLTDDARAIAREESVARHLPYSHLVDERTVATHDGRLMQFIRLRGLLFETADSDELNYRAELRDAMLRAIGTSRFAIYHHILRRRIDVDLGGEYPDSFSAELDRRWKARQATKQLYVNELILTVIRRPLQGRIGLLDRLRSGPIKQARETLNNDLRQLTSAVDGLTSALASYGPELLRVRRDGDAYYSEPLEFLSCLLNGEQRPVRLAHENIANYLPIRRASFGQEAIELGPSGHEPRSFVGMLSVKDYPGFTTPGMLDDILRLPFELTVSQSFAFVERKAVIDRMNLAIRRMRSAEDEAVSLRSELAIAKDEVAAGRAAFGEHHTSFAIRGDTLEEVDEGIAEVSAALADLGIIAVREEIALEPAFWAQFPGNFPYIARRGLVSTSNFASLASLHNFASGRATGNHWGEAVTLLETTSAGPYLFNFHVGDLGNFTVIGPSGSGKTVILNFLLAQARKFGPRIIFFDKDRGAELFIRAIGGSYDRLHPELPSGLNPLQLPDTPLNRQFLMDWLAVLAGGASAEEAADIRDAVEANYAQPGLRRLRYLVELFRGGHRPHSADLYARLRPWWGDGERAWLFDNELDRTDVDARTVGFDMTAVLDDPVSRTSAMLYLFHRVEERLDGSPAIIVIDEGWKALDDEVFVRRIKDWEKTIRKRNGIVGFATQNAEDALSSKISGAIIEQAATQIFMPNPKARAEDYIGGFGLSSHEYEIVRTLPDASRAFLVRQGNESAVVRLDLIGEKEILTILSGRERSVRLLDEIRGQVGDDPQAWMPELMERL
ncbi:MAG: VirB4 family type IV secretion/conjugal transfer ATPase [Pseudomonadota bacterium]|nr:VirB4 family type IV secretion/conjugal transfer ATPase [Pseudomonadota bacterium]